MEATPTELCPNCTKPLPSYGYFCGNCLTQFKCRTCESILQKEYTGCVNCGTPKQLNSPKTNSPGLNTFRLHETTTGRTIEATFSDNVGKDLTDMLKDTYALKLGNLRSDVIKQMGNIKDVTETEAGIADININEKPIEAQVRPMAESTTHPTLLAISMKNLPNSETEWVVVYSFYASNFGKNIFTQQNIIDKYEESKRKNTDRMHVLTIYIKQAVKSGYINPLNEGFSILDKGVDKAKEIISRTTGSIPKPKSSSNKEKKVDSDKSKSPVSVKRNSNVGKGLKRLTNIDFFPSNKESLQAFFGRFSPTSDNDRNLLFVFYLQEVLQIPAISFDHIYTCYDSLDLRVSENLRQTVRNTKSKTGWIETEDPLNIMITVKGRNQMKLWSKKD